MKMFIFLQLKVCYAIDSLNYYDEIWSAAHCFDMKKLNEARFRFPNFLLVFLLFLRSDQYYVMRIGVSKFWSDLLRGRCNEHNSINYFIKFHLNSYLVAKGEVSVNYTRHKSCTSKLLNEEMPILSKYNLSKAKLHWLLRVKKS